MSPICRGMGLDSTILLSLQPQKYAFLLTAREKPTCDDRSIESAKCKGAFSLIVNVSEYPSTDWTELWTDWGIDRHQCRNAPKRCIKSTYSNIQHVHTYHRIKPVSSPSLINPITQDGSFFPNFSFYSMTCSHVRCNYLQQLSEGSTLIDVTCGRCHA